MGRVETHSAMSLLIFCLPVGVITYWLFQGLVKTPVLEVAARRPVCPLAAFRAPANIRSARQWVLAACGVLGGAVTHLVWDAFTHEGARGVRWFPVLDDPRLEIGSRHFDGVTVLQDLSSLIGLVAVLALVAYGLRRGHEPAVPNRLVPRTERRAVGAGLCAGRRGHKPRVLCCGCDGHSRRCTRDSRSISTMAVAALRGLAAALLGVSVVLDLRLRALRYRSSGPDR